MEDLFLQSVSAIANFLTMEKITALSVIIAVIYGAINVRLMRKDEQSKQDELLFNIATANLDDAIHTLEDLDNDNANDSFAWSVVAEQLSAFHNVAIEISSNLLRRCYCAKLNSYMLRIRNILGRIDDYKFYYGVRDYKSKSADILLRESSVNHKNISVNALYCIMQFISLFHGARGDYMFNEVELNKILRPVYYGLGSDHEYTADEISKMPRPFRVMHQYINEWRDGIQKIRSENNQ